MPQRYTTTDQVRFLKEWFNSWSELQRDDFLPVIAQALNPTNYLNGLVGGLASMGVSGRPPSLFACQVKLFHDWFGNWTDVDRENFLEHIRQQDDGFHIKLEKHVQKQEMNGDVTTPLNGIQIETTQEETSYDTATTESTPSSPLSSLPLSQSPQDSTVEENTVEIEKNGQNNIEILQVKNENAEQTNKPASSPNQLLPSEVNQESD